MYYILLNNILLYSSMLYVALHLLGSGIVMFLNQGSQTAFLCACDWLSIAIIPIRSIAVGISKKLFLYENFRLGACQHSQAGADSSSGPSIPVLLLWLQQQVTVAAPTFARYDLYPINIERGLSKERIPSLLIVKISNFLM